MIQIEKLSDSHIESLLQIRLTEDQAKYSSTPKAFLAEHSNLLDMHVIKSDGLVAGFFKLDTAYSEHYDFCPSDALGLRSFAVGSNFQGRGIGTGAVRTLLPYLQANYYRFNWIYLTVNLLNPAARVCYLKGGFEDSGAQYLGGSRGPQHIMRAKITGPNK